MRTIFIVLLVLAVLFLILAGACSLAGFTQIGKDEEKEREHSQGKMIHEEEDGI